MSKIKADDLQKSIEDLRARVSQQDARISQQDARMELLESTIELKSNTIKVLKEDGKLLRERVTSLEDRVGNVEQYTRRTSLRIYGVKLPPKGQPENSDDVMKIVEDSHKAMDVPFDRKDIFRAHRVGRTKKEKDGKFSQPIIVRWKDWGARCAFYRARPTKRKPFPRKSKAKFSAIGLDLTRERRELLETARELVAKHKDDSCFAFADINCNLAVKLGENNFKYFSTMAELAALFPEDGDGDDDAQQEVDEEEEQEEEDSEKEDDD